MSFRRRLALSCGAAVAIVVVLGSVLGYLVVRGTLPVAVRQSMELWVGCVAGALSESDYRAKLGAAGFTGIELEVTREYTFDDAKAFLTGEGLDPERLAREVDGRVVSAFIRASRPERGADEAGACCGPTCCS